MLKSIIGNLKSIIGSGLVNVEKFQELEEDFLLQIKNTVDMDEIPEDLIINFDQTGLNYVPVTSWTMEEARA